jgi:predicted O-methyltransferase YrrM
MSCPAHELAVSRRMLDWEDVDLIQSMVGSLGEDPRIADLGAGSGTTAAAIYAVRPLARVVTVDIVEENLDWASLFLKNCNYSRDRWTALLSDSVEAAASFEDGELDMLMIDTSHEYEPTVRELVAWLPKLRKQGLVWLHDYRGVYPGVTRAVNEAIADGRLVQADVRGLGWGGRKA